MSKDEAENSIVGGPSVPEGDPAGSASRGLRGKSARGAAWMALQSLFALGSQSVVFFVLMALLDPKDFGVVAAASVVMAFAGLIVGAGFGEALVQRESVSDRTLSTAFWAMLAIALLVTGAVWAASAPLAVLLSAEGPGGEPAGHGPELLTWIIRVMSLTFVMTALQSVPTAVLQRTMNFRPLTVRTVAANTVAAVAGVSAALLGAGAWSLVIQQLSAGAVGAALLWTLTRWRPTIVFDRGEFAPLVRFSVSVLGLRALDTTNGKLEQFLLAGLLGQAALGLYVGGKKIVEQGTRVFYSTLGSVTLSSLSRIGKDRARLDGAMSYGVRVSLLAFGPVFAGLAAVAPDVMAIFGERWEPAAFVLQMACAIGLARVVSFFPAVSLTAWGRPGARVPVGIVGVGMSVAAFFIGAQWGIHGVAAAMAVRSWLMTPIGLFVARRVTRLDVRGYLSAWAPGLMCAAAVFGAVWAGGASPWLEGAGAAARLAALLPLGTLVGGAVGLSLCPRAVLDLADAAGHIGPASRASRVVRRVVESMHPRLERTGAAL